MLCCHQQLPSHSFSNGGSFFLTNMQICYFRVRFSSSQVPVHAPRVSLVEMEVIPEDTDSDSSGNHSNDDTYAPVVYERY